MFDLMFSKLVVVDGLGEFWGQDWVLVFDMVVVYFGEICFVDDYIVVFCKVVNQFFSEFVYVYMGRLVFEMVLLIVKFFSDYFLCVKFKSEFYFYQFVKNLFYVKFGGIMEVVKQIFNFQQIYKLMIFVVDIILNNM